MSNASKITPNSEPTNDNLVVTKNYADSLSENNRIRRDLSTMFNDPHKDFDTYILTNLDSFTVKRNPSSDNELSNKTYVDDESDKTTTMRFNQTSNYYFKVSVGNDIYNLTK